MAPRRDRTTSAALLATFVVIAQAVALIFLSQPWMKAFPPPRDISWFTMVRFRGEYLASGENLGGVGWWICAVQVPSGKIRDTNLPPLSPWYGMVANEATVWVVSGNGVIESDGLKHVSHATTRTFTAPRSLGFLYDNRLAIIVPDVANIKLRLLVFENGDWEDRGEVAIPGPERTWVKDAATGQLVLGPKTGIAQASPSHGIRVHTVGTTNHVFQIESNLGVICYREGLDLHSNDAESPSALAAENIAADTTGWTKLEMRTLGWGSIAVHQGKLVVVEDDREGKKIRFWEKPLFPPNQPFQLKNEIAQETPALLSLIEKPETDELFLVQFDHPLRQRFYRYQDGQLQPLVGVWETTLTRFADWIAYGLMKLVLVLLLGTVALVAGAEWIRRGDTSSPEMTDTLPFAPIWRRSLARGIDVAIVLAWPVAQLVHLGSWRMMEIPLDLLHKGRPQDSDVHFAVWSSMLWIGLVFTSIALMQGQWGLTPGKILFRLRTLRSTGQTCGFARSLLRELLLVLDTVALVTITPGILSMLLTDRCQRIGDRMADTMVVNAVDAKRLSQSV